MSKIKPPAPEFIGARYHGGRQVPKAIVIHGTVSSDNAGTARNIAKWWNGPTSPKSSAHYVVDPTTVIQCVGDHTVAFHCGYNNGSIAVELCDEQAGPASRWDDADSRAILARAAKLVARLCLAYGIEVKRPTVQALQSRGPHGIYGHDDSRRAFGRTSHTDPREFPWERFVQLVARAVRELREDEPPAPKATRTLKFLHASLQYNDTPAQKRADIGRIFSFGADVITGTEAGPGTKPTPQLLRQAARRAGYRLALFGRADSWVAVRESLAVGNVAQGYLHVLDHGRKAGDRYQYSDRGVAWLAFDTPDLGRISVGAVHYLTKGRNRKQTAPGRLNHYALNERYAREVSRWAAKAGKGSALAFVGGDFNIVDRVSDVFFGGPLTTCWDELKKWPDTGHGNIDAVASYDHDGRVRCVGASALTDKKMPMHTDHFMVVARYEVEVLK